MLWEISIVEVVVKYFASMRERFGRNEDRLEINDMATVGEVWRCISNGEPLPDNTLVALNMEYANASEQVKDGDEVAFFPTVTGG